MTVAGRIGVPVEDVADWWGPTLRAWEIVAVGPPTLEGRHDLFDELDRTWPRQPSGARKGGFWKQFARMVREDEGCDIDANGVRKWWDQHQERCARRRPGNVAKRGVVRRRDRRASELAKVATGRASPNLPPTLTPGEVATVLGVSRATVRRLMVSGDLSPAERTPGGWRN